MHISVIHHLHDYHPQSRMYYVLSLSTFLHSAKVFFSFFFSFVILSFLLQSFHLFSNFLFCTGYIHENNCVHNNPVELVDYHLKYLGARF